MKNLIILIACTFTFLTTEAKDEFNPWGWGLLTQNQGDTVRAFKAYIENCPTATKSALIQEVGQAEWNRVNAAIALPAPLIYENIRINVVQEGDSIRNHGINTVDGIYEAGLLEVGVTYFEYRLSQDESWSRIVYKIGTNFCINLGKNYTPTKTTVAALDCGGCNTTIVNVTNNYGNTVDYAAIARGYTQILEEKAGPQKPQADHMSDVYQTTYVTNVEKQIVRRGGGFPVFVSLGLNVNRGGGNNIPVSIPTGGGNNNGPQPPIFTPAPQGGVDGGYNPNAGTDGGYNPNAGTDGGFGG